MNTSPRLKQCVLAGLALFSASLLSQAGTFTANFNSGIPAGVNLQGVASNYDHSTGGVGNSGVLKLTETVGNQLGGAIIDDFDGGAVVGGFDVTFDLNLGSGNGADGLSFFFGDFADGAYSEEGPGNINGLTISFDVFNNGGTPPEAPAIDLKWNNVILIHRLVGAASATTGAQPIGTSNTIRTQTTTGGAPVYWPVKIHVDTDGTLDLVYNNVVVYTNVPIFRPITEITRGPAARFGFGARTGGSTDNHWIDNLSITTVPIDAQSGQPYITAMLPVALSSATAGGPGSPVAGVLVEMRDGPKALNPASVTMTYNGAAVTPAVTRDNDVTRIVYRGPTGVLPSGVGTVVLNYATSSTPPYTNSFTYSFLVGTSSIIPDVYALPSADRSKPGFKVKVHQMDKNRNPATGQFSNAERQIAHGYIDPETGKPYPNTADLTLAGTDGYFTVEGVWNVNGGDGGGVGNFPNDEPVPGIPGGNDTDRYVIVLETILELKAGGYRFGVNSDDGFRLSIGRGPGDVAGVQLGTAGDRGAADTIMDVVIGKDGFYPLRLMWWETGGGSSCELFFIDGTGVKRLINDPSVPAPMMAYRESSATPPYVSRALPPVNYNWVHADQDLVIDVTDGASPLTAGSAVLTINGAAQTITTTKAGNVTTLTRASSLSNLLPSSANNVRLIYATSSGGTTLLVTNDWTFTVPPYTRPIPPANKVTAAQVTGSGFKIRTHQIDRAPGTANQANGGRYTGQSGGGNNMPRPEIQLSNGYINPANNQPYPNLASLTGANPDGTFDIPEVLNFNHQAAAGGPAVNAGIFNQDSQIPGIPGTGSSNFGLDNTVHEIFTYLNLRAGAHILALNVDDGWTCTSAPNPRDTLGTLLGWRNAPGGQNGNPANVPNAAFNVLVQEDGIYPIRILFWQGGGGINLEFFSIDRATGTQILVNDSAGSFPSVVGNSGQLLSPISAQNTYTGPVRPWVKYSVYPPPTHATLWQNYHQQSGPGPIRVKVGVGNPVDIANDEGRSDQALVNRPFGDAIGAVVADLGSGSVGMVLNGVSVTPTVTELSGSPDKLVLYTPNPPLASGSTHTAGLVYGGSTNFWTFTVIAYTNAPASVALPSAAADPSARGFRAKVVQASTTATLANTVARAEVQLAGTPANIAAAGSGPDGSYIIPGIINWNVTKSPGGTPSDIGNFTPALTSNADDPVPGIPGTGLTGNARFENIAAEIFAWLELPAGYQKFGVGGDDGWKVQIGTPGQTNGTILFTRDRGAGARNIPFAFITPQAGLYPVRLVWYQGAGGGNLEFFTYGPNNEIIPVNSNHPNAVKAYYNVTGGGPVTGPKFTSIRRNANGSLTIEWDGGGTLEAATAITGPWAPVAGATSPFTFTPSGQVQFGRIRK